MLPPLLCNQISKNPDNMNKRCLKKSVSNLIGIHLKFMPYFTFMKKLIKQISTSRTTREILSQILYTGSLEMGMRT